MGKWYRYVLMASFKFSRECSQNLTNKILKRVCSAKYTELYVNGVKMTVTQIHIKVSDPPASLAGGDSQGMASCDPVSI